MKMKCISVNEKNYNLNCGEEMGYLATHNNRHFIRVHYIMNLLMYRRKVTAVYCSLETFVILKPVVTMI